MRLKENFIDKIKINNFKLKNNTLKKYLNLAFKLGIIFLILCLLSYLTSNLEGFQDAGGADNKVLNVVNELKNKLTSTIEKVNNLVVENTKLKNIIENITKKIEKPATGTETENEIEKKERS